ncbi:hypothetical protein BD309DRAFT_964640 [Dichomitus squalens]|uniref:Uncharacterized protein n=1 Tax=Dichomitus squalens TaxID=114155 RepID=A0A4Q9PYG5_9APHY|nr:hypothetical protein BD309DRAFT_964640 [Dichomitus squalens]TBU59344.1 hypothetical protein BD310DRAFT_925359 [Dichomitus squalens]
MSSYPKCFRSTLSLTSLAQAQTQCRVFLFERRSRLPPHGPCADRLRSARRQVLSSHCWEGRSTEATNLLVYLKE